MAAANERIVRRRQSVRPRLASESGRLLALGSRIDTLQARAARIRHNRAGHIQRPARAGGHLSGRWA